MKKWTILSETLVQYNKRRRYLKVRCRLPNGRTSDFYVTAGGTIVCALVVTTDQKIVLADQFRLGPNTVLGELPGGGAHTGERPATAIAREVLEETGYRGWVRALGRSYVSAWFRGVRHHFLITNAQKVAKPTPDEFEMSEPLVVSVAELKRRLGAGNLTDSETAYRGLEALGKL